jgi:hypothetical protein
MRHAKLAVSFFIGLAVLSYPRESVARPACPPGYELMPENAPRATDDSAPNIRKCVPVGAVICSNGKYCLAGQSCDDEHHGCRGGTGKASGSGQISVRPTWVFAAVHFGRKWPLAAKFQRN